MKNLAGRIAGLTVILAPLWPVSIRAEWGLNLPTPVTPMGAEILGLHNMIMLICLIIFVVVFGAMFYSIYAHRKSRGAVAAKFSHSTRIEIVWSVVPFLILVGMAVPSTATLIRMEDTTEADMTVKVTGYQWFWQYQYMEDDVDFYSRLSTPRTQIENTEEKGENYLLEVDREVVLPVGKKVRLLLTANDVIHSWWVPELGIKKDAIPGTINAVWVRIEKPGVYRGQCTELCGKDHGYMPVVVKAVSEEEFQAWVEENRSGQAAVDNGESSSS